MRGGGELCPQSKQLLKIVTIIVEVIKDTKKK